MLTRLVAKKWRCATECVCNFIQPFFIPKLKGFSFTSLSISFYSLSRNESPYALPIIFFDYKTVQCKLYSKAAGNNHQRNPKCYLAVDSQYYTPAE